MTEKTKIFVIDDDRDIVELISYNLEKKGYATTSASSGLFAIWTFEEDQLPNLILLDLMMPSPDGYELCKYLKSSDEFRHIPLIIISARGTRKDIEKGLALGADAYLPKPFSIDLLMQYVQKFTC